MNGPLTGRKTLAVVKNQSYSLVFVKFGAIFGDISLLCFHHCSRFLQLERGKSFFGWEHHMFNNPSLFTSLKLIIITVIVEKQCFFAVFLNVIIFKIFY